MKAKVILKEAVLGLALSISFFVVVGVLISLALEIRLYAKVRDQELLLVAMDDAKNFARRIGLQSQVVHAVVVQQEGTKFSKTVLVTDRENRCFEVTVEFFLYEVVTTTGALSAASQRRCLEMIAQHSAR